MTGLALVLAGGGLAGIAWETGVLAGIADMSPGTAAAVLDADVLVGTSAGSAVAAQIGSDTAIGRLYDRQVAADTHELDPGVGIEEITAVFLQALTGTQDTGERLRRIGQIALAADTVPEATRRAIIEHRLPSHDWPGRALRITAIDTATGEPAVFTADSGVPLVDAVAASCAVPGVWPPVTIGSARYMDGGVLSTVHMPVAADCARAVVLVPAGEHAPAPFGAGAAADIAGFGGATFAVFADDDALAAFGPNPLDPACRVPSAAAGFAQGRRVAAALSEFLGS
ncbi:patatin-like phospholipase family protein [Mycolicibacterium neoaurum]|uniref:patatin-like phospholipase family protein n=1 Tax=Mycolicibacterium neoaurum TaxID=1795 RepID=UPI002672A017|nr:patatin-like phospholipase family protein [Mycolicibacterium neoaurum]MDO3401090.1 patatin-like phospholipase family protein [Mycolicibacterium neoaurum]